jgi:drug/metabolite transporter (DMT)-like permease
LTAGGGRLDARAICLAVFAMAILGGSYTAGKFALQDLPMFGMLAVRMILATLALGAYAAMAGLVVRPRASSFGYLAAQTGLFVMTQTLLFIALQKIDAGRSAILFNMQPFFTLLLLPVLVPSEHLTPRRWLGTAVAFGGVALVLAERGTQGGSLVADLMVLVAALGWTCSIMLNKRMPADVNPVSVILWSSAGSIPVYALLSLLFESGATWALTGSAVASVLYLGIAAGGLGFVLMVWLIRAYSASRVNVFVFLSPVFGVLIGWAALGETMSAQQALGAMAVAGGILIVTAER